MIRTVKLKLVLFGTIQVEDNGHSIGAVIEHVHEMHVKDILDSLLDTSSEVTWSDVEVKSVDGMAAEEF